MKLTASAREALREFANELEEKMDKVERGFGIEEPAFTYVRDWIADLMAERGIAPRKDEQ